MFVRGMNLQLEILIFRRFKEASRQIACAVHHALDAQHNTIVAIENKVNSKPSADGK